MSYHKRCTVCRHEERTRIELLHAGGASFSALAEKFGPSSSAIKRHWHHHVTAEAKASYLLGPGSLEALAERAAKEGDSVLDYLKLIRTSLTAQLTAASEAGDARTVAYVAGQLTRTCESLARITGELGELARSTTYNVTSITNNMALFAESPVFLRMQAAILQALAPFPEARLAVVKALRTLDENEPQANVERLAAVPGPIIDNE